MISKGLLNRPSTLLNLPHFILHHLVQGVERRRLLSDGEERDQVAAVCRHDDDTEQPPAADERPARVRLRQVDAACNR